MFEAIEAALDEVALLVQAAVVRVWLLPVPPRRDDGGRSQGFDRSDDFGRVIALISDDGFGLLALQQADCLGIFGRLSGDAEVHRQPGFIG